MFTPFIKIGTLCVILNVLCSCLSCQYFQCLLEDKSDLEPNISTASFKNESENHHLPQELCTPTKKVKKIINPYKDITECSTKGKMFKSACMQCAACLAIAQQIDENMQDIDIGNLDPKIEVEMIDDILKSLCTNGFKEFDLRSYKEHIILMKASRSTSHVPSKMNGRWPTKLREICSRYLEHINVLTFYTILLKESNDIEDYLCRSDGVFRDCFNIDFRRNPTIEEQGCHLEIPDILFTVTCTNI